ncbi:hypothetical protein GCK32_002386 [Trichostrongylus colubriformis]|uniref:Uncharacterized protein n=1 Tax=Trichostrongylus colubriformis TaxID=6319 RepID=A0AAN8FK95_TRICO
MENGMNIALEEKARVDSLIRKCFPDVDDFEQSVSYTLAVQPNRKSFWSRIVRVFLHWNNEKLSSRYPKSIFVKIPHVSENVGNSDKSGVDNSAADAETLLILTKFEILWYERFGADTIPYFPMPKFYAAETVTESGTGIIAMEDLSERVKAMDLIPGGKANGCSGWIPLPLHVEKGSVLG